MPVIRHPWLVCHEDSSCLETKYQFFVGDDLLVLPVTERGATSVSGYFPIGEWKHYFTGEIVEGGKWIEIDSPVGTPAVYWRK